MIGVFDSGLGGLTVVKELMAVLPGYDIVYFGDTARLPYGNKSTEAVTRFTREGLTLLRERGAQIIVIACHTASAIAGETMKKEFASNPPPSFPPPSVKGEVGWGIPIFEVVSPSVLKARAATRSGRVGVIGTRTTISSNVYHHRLETPLNPPLSKGGNHEGGSSRITNNELPITVHTQSCPLFVPFIEEGEARSAELKRIAKKYLRPLLQKGIDTLVLACTHYPLIKPLIAQIAGKRVVLVDPAHEVAQQVKAYLAAHPELEHALPKSGKLKILVSDLTPHFERIAMQWLGKKIAVAKVEMV